mgnify:CR=1 FL=1|jgi:hypothetical protein
MTYYELNKESIKARKRERYANDPEYRERHKSYNKQYQEDKPEVHNKSNSKWAKNNPGIKNALIAKYRAAKLQRTPSWADDLVIRMIYEDCPKGYQVDHIVPLQGASVSGLHVAHNLQYLTPTENQTKGNRL